MTGKKLVGEHVTTLTGQAAESFLKEYDHHFSFSVVDKSTPDRALVEIQWVD